MSELKATQQTDHIAALSVMRDVLVNHPNSPAVHVYTRNANTEITLEHEELLAVEWPISSAFHLGMFCGDGSRAPTSLSQAYGYSLEDAPMLYRQIEHTQSMINEGIAIINKRKAPRDTMSMSLSVMWKPRANDNVPGSKLNGNHHRRVGQVSITVDQIIAVADAVKRINAGRRQVADAQTDVPPTADGVIAAIAAWLDERAVPDVREVLLRPLRDATAKGRLDDEWLRYALMTGTLAWEARATFPDPFFALEVICNFGTSKFSPQIEVPRKEATRALLQCTVALDDVSAADVDVNDFTQRAAFAFLGMLNTDGCVTTVNQHKLVLYSTYKSKLMFFADMLSAAMRINGLAAPPPVVRTYNTGGKPLNVLFCNGRMRALAAQMVVWAIAGELGWICERKVEALYTVAGLQVPQPLDAEQRLRAPAVVTPPTSFAAFAATHAAGAAAEAAANESYDLAELWAEIMRNKVIDKVGDDEAGAADEVDDDDDEVDDEVDDDDNDEVEVDDDDNDDYAVASTSMWVDSTSTASTSMWTGSTPAASTSMWTSAVASTSTAVASTAVESTKMWVDSTAVASTSMAVVSTSMAVDVRDRGWDLDDNDAVDFVGGVDF